MEIAVGVVEVRLIFGFGQLFIAVSPEQFFGELGFPSLGVFRLALLPPLTCTDLRDQRLGQHHRSPTHRQSGRRHLRHARKPVCKPWYEAV